MGGKFNKLRMEDMPLVGKTVLVRADYNVPLSSDGAIADDYRLKKSLPTLRYLLNNDCKVVVISHLGRPDGKVDARYSLEPVARHLAKLLQREVRFIDKCVGPKVSMAVKRAPKSSVILLENLRFHKEEEANDSAFAKNLAKSSNASYFIQDGFGVVHRAHASTDAITQYLPSSAGKLLQRECNVLLGTMKDPEQPLVAVLGGAKVSDKISVIRSLIEVADQIVIGGAMANTFLAFNHHQMGKSRVEPGQSAEISKIYKLAKDKVGEQIDKILLIPTDLGVRDTTNDNSRRRNVEVSGIMPSDAVLDIGPSSTRRMLSKVRNAKTVIWSGTLGVCELPEFATASNALANGLTSRADLISVVGGGDTADFAIHWNNGRGKGFTHISTGGSASLELMSGMKLPGIESLLPAKK